MKNGWQTVAFGELGRLFNGNSISEAEKKANFEGLEEGVPYIGTKDVSFDHEIEYESGVKVPDHKQDGFKLAPANTVLICAEGGSAGRKIAHTDRAVYFGNKLFAICPKHPNSSRFVFYYCLSDDFATQFRGAMAGLIGGVSMNKFKELSITLPPPAEQQRIIGLLDEAFADLATAQASAERNVQNARALFESHLQSVFTQRGKGWVEKRLGDVVTRLTNGYVGPTRTIYHDSGVPYLLARHVKDNRLLFDGRTFITDEFNRKNKKSMLKAGDVLLVQSGHIGHSAVVTVEHEGHNCHAMIVITPVEGAFIGPFLSLFFNSSGMKQKFQEIRSGSTVPHLTCGEVRELMVALPDLATQQRLVDRSLELESETRRLAHLYERKLAALAALKQSLLHHAFSAEL